MIELRVSEAAALTIVEQADYFRQASDNPLAERWESARRSGCAVPDGDARTWCTVPFSASDFGRAAMDFRSRVFEAHDFLPLFATGRGPANRPRLHGARNLEAILEEES